MMNHHYAVFLSVAALGLPGHFSFQGAQLSPQVKPTPPAITQSIKQVAPLKPIVFTPLPELQPVPFPVAPMGTYENTYAAGNCTWYVASRKNIPNSWGNANTWATDAQTQGLTISGSPIIGAIAQTAAPSLGHVAIVTDISGDQVQVSEMNVLGYGVVDQAWYSIDTFQYIYI